MRKVLICTSGLFIIFFSFSFAQTDQQFKQDSTVKAREIFQLGQEAAKIKAQQAIDDLNKKTEKDKLQDEKDAKQAEIDKIESINKLLGGDSTPTSLSGGISISKGDAAMAETRVLVFRGLNDLIKIFLDGLNKNKRFNLKCEDADSTKLIDIIIYNKDYIQSINDYESMIAQIARINKLYREYTKKAIAAKSSAEGFDPAGIVSVATTAIKSVINLATLFRSETQLIINNEEIDEEILVSKFRDIDDCAKRAYYYPAIFPLAISLNSALIDSLDATDIEKAKLTTAIKDFRDSKVKILDDKITKLQKQIDENTNKLKTIKGKEEIKNLKKIIENNKTVVENDQSDKTEKLALIIPIENNQKALDDLFAKINTALETIIDENTKTTLFRNFLKIEALNEKINSGAYILKLTSVGSGTNKIKKYLWGTSLKHSAKVEATFSLMNNKREVVFSKSNVQYSPFMNSRNINKKK